MIKFKVHFESNKNSMHEKAMFHLRAQRVEECVIFPSALYEVADGCDFTSKNEEIKD